VRGTEQTGPVQIRFGGYGGQGIVLAGTLLGKAASLYDGKEAVFTQAYGPEARGGASRADVIIADEPIDYPYVTQPDVLVALFQEAYTLFGGQLKPGGVLIVEEDLVRLGENAPPASSLPATRMAEELGNRIVTNVIVLGFLVGRTGVVSRGAAEQALRATVKPGALELNLRAFDAGFARADARKAAASS
jgi:2-oxoglutarate ferredoxin oxidoreductase subunit gamma